MNRTEWKFTYTASKLADAAKAKMMHHADRLEWWHKKHEDTMAKVKESGIEVHQAVAAEYSHSNVARGVRPEIRIDETLQRDLYECDAKMKEHSAKIGEYDGWLQVFNANPEARLELQHDDYLHFFGK